MSGTRIGKSNNARQKTNSTASSRDRLDSQSDTEVRLLRPLEKKGNARETGAKSWYTKKRAEKKAAETRGEIRLDYSQEIFQGSSRQKVGNPGLGSQWMKKGKLPFGSCNDHTFDDRGHILP